MNATLRPVPAKPPPAESRAAAYDAFHGARARSDLTARLYAAAMGEDYPAEVAASSSCDWPLLGLMTARLRMSQGQLLVDAGCGTGGVGLWLARALAVRLDGFRWWSVFGTKRGKRKKAGGPVHDDLVRHDFTAAGLLR
ncbi:hypothetical protein [Streptomyces sp. NPDC060205]|uniref:hypothetical protein n=1 Tax=Streptomyces sp. NPDC060205 TaxID=3347072 RepID=UPI003662D133